MPVASLSIRTATKSRKNQVFQTVPSFQSSIPYNSSIFFDDPKTCIYASLIGQYPETYEHLFITVPSPYCSQVPSLKTTISLQSLISSLHCYELRSGKKTKRRLVRGMKETLRHLRLGHIRLLIVAIDIDEDAIDGTAWRSLLHAAQEKAVPTIFGMTRVEMTVALGRSKRIETSAIGVLNPDGAYQIYQELVSTSLDSNILWTGLTAEIALEELMNDRLDILHILSYYGHTNVLLSLKNTNPEMMRKIVDRPNRHDGCTALMLACSVGEFKVVRLLLDIRAEALLKDFRLQTSLHYAASAGCIDCMDILLKSLSQAELDTALGLPDASGLDPLHRAILAGNEPVVSLLLTNKSGPIGMDYVKILLKVEKPLATICSLLINKCTLFELDQLSELINGFAKIGSLECLRVIIDWIKNGLRLSDENVKAIIDKKSEIDGKSSAWWAAYLGHVAIAKELVHCGADAGVSSSVDGSEFSVSSLLEKWKIAARNT